MDATRAALHSKSTTMTSATSWTDAEPSSWTRPHAGETANALRCFGGYRPVPAFPDDAGEPGPDVRNFTNAAFAYNFANPFRGTHFGHPKLFSARVRLTFPNVD